MMLILYVRGRKLLLSCFFVLVWASCIVFSILAVFIEAFFTQGKQISASNDGLTSASRAVVVEVGDGSAVARSSPAVCFLFDTASAKRLRVDGEGAGAVLGLEVVEDDFSFCTKSDVAPIIWDSHDRGGNDDDGDDGEKKERNEVHFFFVIFVS